MITLSTVALLGKCPMTATGANQTESKFKMPPFVLHAPGHPPEDLIEEMLRAARSRRPPLPEIVLWSTTLLHPSESQTSECSDLLSRSRAACLIAAQRQPGKLIKH